MQHILTANQLTPEILTSVYKQADVFREVLRSPWDSAKRRELRARFAGTAAVLRTVMASPSTRTRDSTEEAARHLGMDVRSYADAGANSSLAKGESLEDMGQMFDQPGSFILLRHPEEGAAARMASAVRHAMVINGGDGSGHHPTQAALDGYTIFDKIGRLHGLRVLFVNDLRYGRTVHSAIDMLTQFTDNEIVCASGSQLSLPGHVRAQVKQSGTSLVETENMYPYLEKADVVYISRAQTERWPKSIGNGFHQIQFGPPAMRRLRPTAIVLHALPKTAKEVSPLIVDDPRFIANEQAANGVPVRMALLTMLAGDNLA